MNIVTLLAALIILAVGVATVVVLIVVACGAGRRSLSRTLFWTGVTLLPLAALVTSFHFIFGPADYTSQKGLAAAYRTEFGADPTGDVTGIQARQVVVGDSGAAWLFFQASPSTIDTLLERFVKSDRKVFAEAGVGGNVPIWWKPDEDGVNEYYTADLWSKNFSRSVAFIGLNRAKSRVYFHHIGSD